jgi:hypothetical protein
MAYMVPKFNLGFAMIKYNNFVTLICFILSFIISLTSCIGSTLSTSAPTQTILPTIQSSTIKAETPTLDYKTIIITPDDIFSLPLIITDSTPTSEDLCENLPIPQSLVNMSNFSILAGRFVLCIYERAFIAMDLDNGSLVSSDDERGDIVLFTSRFGSSENPSYGIGSRGKAHLEDAYVIETYANHSGANNLSYDYCENRLRNQTNKEGGMRVEVAGIACIRTTEGQIALLRVEKIYPAITLSVEFSFAILRSE